MPDTRWYLFGNQIGKLMSVKKFEAMVDEMIHKAPLAPQQYEMAKKIAALLKMVYSEVMSIPRATPRKTVFARIAGKNLGKRIRPRTSRF